jgi:hypothetical protein
MSILWDNVENVYKPLSEELKKGDKVILRIQFDTQIDEFNKVILNSLINGWFYPSKGKNISPFKQLDLSIIENFFEASILIQKRDKEVDEFRLFCQDLLDILNTDNIHVKSWKMSKVDISIEEDETKIDNQDITVPSLNKIRGITLQYDFSLNMDIDPNSGFEIYNEKTLSRFSSLMTEDFSLFSIDVFNPRDEELVNLLNEILESYNLPVAQLKPDFIKFNTDKREIITNYNKYWVHYIPLENEENVLLIRYRKFV